MLIKNNIPERSKSYKLVSTFVRSRHQAPTVRPYHQYITRINLDHYTNTLDEACHQALIIINIDYLNKYNK